MCGARRDVRLRAGRLAIPRASCPCLDFIGRGGGGPERRRARPFARETGAQGRRTPAAASARPLSGAQPLPGLQALEMAFALTKPLRGSFAMETAPARERAGPPGCLE